MSEDPDRYDPSKDTAPAGPLDPAHDPDRFPASPTLPELVGKGSYEDERDGLEWLYGLLGVFAFLGLFTALVYLR
jgi:hypothetical protein